METTANFFTEEPGKMPEILHWVVEVNCSDDHRVADNCVARRVTRAASLTHRGSCYILNMTYTPLRPERPSDMGSFRYISAIQ